MGGGKINFPFNHLKEVEINGDNDGESEGGNENTGGFDIDTFKQTIVDIYNEDPDTDTPITIDNVIMPDAFVMREIVSFDEQQGPTFRFVDADLTKFLASSSIGILNILPLYLKDSFNQNNVYFGNDTIRYKLAYRDGFNSGISFDGITDDEYNGNLDLTNYISLLNIRDVG